MRLSDRVRVPGPVAWSRLPDRADQPIEDCELDGELDAVDAGLVGALNVEQVGVGDAKQADVEKSDEHVHVDELLAKLLVIGVAVLEHRAVLQVLAGLVHVEAGDDGLLDRQHSHFEFGPD